MPTIVGANGANGWNAFGAGAPAGTNGGDAASGESLALQISGPVIGPDGGDWEYRLIAGGGGQGGRAQDLPDGSHHYGQGGSGGAGGSASVGVTNAQVFWSATSWWPTLYAVASSGSGGGGGPGGNAFWATPEPGGRGGDGGAAGMASASLSGSTFGGGHIGAAVVQAFAGRGAGGGNGGGYQTTIAPNGSSTRGGDAVASATGNIFNFALALTVTAVGGLSGVGSGQGAALASVTSNSMIGSSGADAVTWRLEADAGPTYFGSGTPNDYGIGKATIRLTNNNIDLGGGDDTFNLQLVHTANHIQQITGNVISGGDGYDILTFAGSQIIVDGGARNGVVFTFDGNTITGFEQVNGTEGDDILTLSDADEIIYAGEGDDVVNGRGGSDTLAFDQTPYGPYAYGPVTVRMAAGTAVGQGNDRFTSIENIIGSRYGDDIEGDNRANRLQGAGGGDIIRGLGGADVIYGDEGADRLYGGDGDDLLSGGTGGFVNGAWAADFIDGGAGIDTLVAGISFGSDYTLGDRFSADLAAGTFQYVGRPWSGMVGNVENVRGGLLDDVIFGDAGANRLDGLAGNDILDGRDGDDDLRGGEGADILIGGAGADRMAGGLGDDTYYVDNAGDLVIEANGEGVDTVIASVSFSLYGQYAENLTLTGTANLNATGNGQNNIIIGNSGANVIDGGKGADRMEGGRGNDTYYVDNLGDVVIEGANRGNDTVIAAVSFSLAGQHIENLTLTGTGNTNATGNGLNNILIGNAGNNDLNGDAGDDVMTGGLGDDNYYVDSVGDVVVELAGQGHDTVYSSVTWQMGDGIEDLVLTGNDAIAAYGNGLDNVITGNKAANVIDGQGGADVMSGGKGDDTYTVDNLGDWVIEKADGGNDTVYSAVNFSLVGQHIEVLIANTSADVVLVGNGLANYIQGGAGSDHITGGGGADGLTGNGGADVFIYTAVSDSTLAASDTIYDLSSDDILDLHLIDANTKVAGDQAFVRVDAFTHHADEMVYAYDYNAGTMVLTADVNGDGVADFRVNIYGADPSISGWIL